MPVPEREEWLHSGRRRSSVRVRMHRAGEDGEASDSGARGAVRLSFRPLLALPGGSGLVTASTPSLTLCRYESGRT
jgi:hypothetical protein